MTFAPTTRPATRPRGTVRPPTTPPGSSIASLPAAEARSPHPLSPLAVLPVVALLLTVALGGCGVVGVTQDVEQTATADARVATDVKLALIEADGVDAAAVRVVAEGNTVTLDGFVASGEERAAALAAARSAAGDLEVVDEMEVRR